MRLIGLTLLASLVLAACASAPAGPPPPAGVAYVGRQAQLVLPKPPGYPGEREIAQTVIADYGGRKMAFDAVVSLSPKAVHMIVTAPAGPRIAEISWTAEGINGAFSGPAPKGLRNENLLADLFIVNWPAAAVEAAMGPGVTVTDGPEGRRSIRKDGKALVEIAPLPSDGDGQVRRSLRNIEFGYSLELITREAP